MNYNKTELDLKQFVEMFDTAMTSTNPTVKKCFNNLLMVVALAHTEEDDEQLGTPIKFGPLGELIQQIERLEDRILSLERSRIVAETSASMHFTNGPRGSDSLYSTCMPSNLAPPESMWNTYTTDSGLTVNVRNNPPTNF